jgi:hypothetical protein
MTCDQAKQKFADALLATGHDAAHEIDMQAHLTACPGCRQEFMQVQRLWNALDLLPEAEPGPHMRTRFYQALDAYQQGQDAAEKTTSRFWAWWPKQPAFQFALSMALLVLGTGIGVLATHTFNGAKPGTQEISQLRGEISSMRQLVALSLLQQQSASDRLRGVNWSYRVPQSDTEVLGALLHTINQDSSVDVRMAAVEALHNFADSPVARKGLAQALAKQTSPLMQITIIDQLVDLKERPAATAIRTLLERADLDENVRKRGQVALEQLR